MKWKAPLAVVLTGLALVIGTVVTVANGHDGTPAVTVLVSAARPRYLRPCPCRRPRDRARWSPRPCRAGGHTVSGACSGTVSGSAVCGDATGSVALALQTSAGPDGTFSLIMQFENDPIGTGPQPASLFVEVHRPDGFLRWSDRSATVPVTAQGQILMSGVTLPAEAGTHASPLVLSGSATCASDE